MFVIFAAVHYSIELKITTPNFIKRNNCILACYKFERLKHFKKYFQKQYKKRRKGGNIECKISRRIGPAFNIYDLDGSWIGQFSGQDFSITSNSVQVISFPRKLERKKHFSPSNGNIIMSKNKTEKTDAEKTADKNVAKDDVAVVGRPRFHLSPTAKKMGAIMVFSFHVPLWLSTPTQNKLYGILGAFLFSVIESCFTKLSDGKAHTTVHQWVMNALVLPWYLCGFLDATESAGYGLLAKALLFPFVIWLLEILQGYSLQILFNGVNPAWEYLSKDSLFHGNIRLMYFPLWVLLGLAAVLVSPPARVFCDLVAQDYILRPLMFAFEDVID